MNTDSSNSDMTRTWVYGKVTPGWYVARGIWDPAYSQHLESLGYQVVRSVSKPTGVAA